MIIVSLDAFAVARCRSGFTFLDWLDEALRHGSGDHGVRLRSRGVIGESFQVQDGGGWQELVLGPRQSTQSHILETELVSVASVSSVRISGSFKVLDIELNGFGCPCFM